MGADLALKRHAAEVVELLGEEGSASRDILDLARGLGPERIEATFAASWQL